MRWIHRERGRGDTYALLSGFSLFPDQYSLQILVRVYFVSWQVV